MENQFFHRHQVAVLDFVKEAMEKNLENILKKTATQYNVEVQDFEKKQGAIYFSLIGFMPAIVKYIDEFNEKNIWQIREMGVSEFARIMELSDEDAASWYHLFNQNHQSIIYGSPGERELERKILEVQDLEKLEYIQTHVIGKMKDSVVTRIQVLRGEDPFGKYVDRLVKVEKIKEKLKEMLTQEKEMIVSKETIEEILQLL